MRLFCVSSRCTCEHVQAVDYAFFHEITGLNEKTYNGNPGGQDREGEHARPRKAFTSGKATTGGQDLPERVSATRDR
jgi:hypothetical protein